MLRSPNGPTCRNAAHLYLQTHERVQPNGPWDYLPRLHEEPHSQRQQVAEALTVSIFSAADSVSLSAEEEKTEKHRVGDIMCYYYVSARFKMKSSSHQP